MRYGIPTRVYNLSSDHLGGLLNLMSDLHDWITKGYIIKINVYLIHYRERLNKILDSDIYKIELVNYHVLKGVA